MEKVGIIEYGMSPFSTKDLKIETILADSASKLLKKNPRISREDIGTVLVSTNKQHKIFGFNLI